MSIQIKKPRGSEGWEAYLDDEFLGVHDTPALAMEAINAEKQDRLAATEVQE